MEIMRKPLNNEDNALYRKVQEIRSLRHKLQRYQRRLVLEGLKKNKKPIIAHSVDDTVDVTPLVELVKDDFPSLYRRYHTLKERYAKGIDYLEKILK